MAKTDEYLAEATQTIYELSADQRILEQCRRRKEVENEQRYYITTINSQKELLAEQKSQLAEQKNQLDVKDNIIAEKDSKLAEKDAEIAALKAQLNQQNK